VKTARYILGAAAMLAGWLTAMALDGAVSETPTASLTVPVPVPVPEPVPGAVSETDPEAVPVEDGLLGTFRMTRYYVVDEKGFKGPPAAVAVDDFASESLNGKTETVLASAGPAGVTIYDDRGCKPLATLGTRFAEVLDVQGTGRLRDGRVVNVSGPCRCANSPCFRPLSESAKWGLSALSKPLQPFRTVAVDPKVVPLGSLLYVPELDGLTMPGSPPWGGFIHDGCLHAIDVGGGIDGKHLDFFVGKFQFKKALDNRKKMKKVTVYRGDDRCMREGSKVARKAGI
jgi:3D (Asp-Asp-Asp) domain-containing protein